MDNFNWTSFSKKIAIRATIPQLYAAWTVPHEIEKWFLSKAYFENPDGTAVDRNTAVEAEDRYTWSWYLYDISEKGKIIAANGTDLLKFTFAGDCVVEVRLLPQGEDVIVQLTQTNIPTDNQSKQDIRLGCATGWSFFLLNLKSFYEGGIDLRNKNENLKGMVNN